MTLNPDHPWGVYLESLGCAKNQVDSEVMLAALISAGHHAVDDSAQADLILVNTCGFIQPAKQESIDVSLALAGAHPDTPVVMTGCLSQRYATDLAAEMPEIAGFLGNRAPSQVVSLLERVLGGRRVVTADASVPPNAIRRTQLLSLPGSAYLKVAEGCDNRCSFCAIPLIRGAVRSRSISSIVTEARDLLDRGILEINLVAQDLGSFGRDRGSQELVPLLRALTADSRHFWIRLLYIHPERVPTDLLSVMADEPRVLPYLDLPFQHASTPVLREMGRSGSAEEYLRLLATIRERLPNPVIRSTALVGFEAESDAAFQELCAFQEAAELDWLGVFTYSPEEGTPAYLPTPSGQPARRGRPSRKEAALRRDHLMRRQQEISTARMRRFVGQDLELLIEEPVAEEPLAIGRGYPHAPEVDGAVVLHVRPEAPAVAGSAVRCRVIQANGLDLEAVPI